MKFNRIVFHFSWLAAASSAEIWKVLFPFLPLSSLTSTCRRHDIDPQRYLTQLLTNLPATPISQLYDWLPDRCTWRMPAPPA